MKLFRGYKSRGGRMGGTVRVRVRGGVLELLDKVDLPEGEEITVTIIEAPSRRDREAFRRAAGAWKDTVDAETLIRNIYTDRLIATRPEPRL